MMYGVRMMSNVINCDLDEVEIGMQLKPAFVEAREGLTVLYWQPAQLVGDS